MKAYQLKIAIKNSKPPIWRRVIIPEGITFSQLSMILNKAMGWRGYHFFEFEFYHLELRLVEKPEDSPNMTSFDYLDASKTFINEYLEENDWFTYTYDLENNWKHRVTVEQILTNYESDYPQVIKYKGDCPLEDSGGIYEYYNLLESLKDKNAPDYEDKRNWMKMQGYPNLFDLQAVNKELKEVFFYKWGKGEQRLQHFIYEEFLDGTFGLNAKKKAKNKQVDIIRSPKHQMEDSLSKFLEHFKHSFSNLQNTFDSTLKDVFYDFTKSDIYDIASRKGLKNISKCNKDALIDRLVAFMLQKEEMERYFLCLEDNELSAFETACKANSSENLEPLLFQKLYESCYVGMLSNGTYIIPTDVAKMYKTITGSDFTKKRINISYLLCCLNAAGILYGIVPLNVIMDMLKTNPDIHLSEQDVRDLIDRIPMEFNEFFFDGDIFYHAKLYPDDRGLLEAQGDKKYYIPTKAEIMDLAMTGHLPNSRSLKNFRQFLTNDMAIPSEQAVFAAGVIQSTICGGGNMQEIYDIMEDLYICPMNEMQMNTLIKHINNLWNHTRMLLNRGFTPNELSKGIKQQMIPARVPNNVVNFETAKKKKIYPNAPCPCGSGKKYKNCCKNKI